MNPITPPGGTAGQPGAEREVVRSIGGGAALCGAAVIVATFGVLTRWASPMLTATGVTACRFGLAAVAQAGINAPRHRVMRVNHTDAAILVLLGALVFGLGLAFTIAVTHTRLAAALSIQYASSITTAGIIGALAFGERLTYATSGSMMLALTGLVAFMHAIPHDIIGILAAIAAGICDAASNAIRKRLAHLDRSVAVTWQYTIGAAFAICLIALTRDAVIRTVEVPAVLALVGLAIGSMALGNALLYGFARVGIASGSVIMSTQVGFTIVAGRVFAGERLGAYELVGAAVTCCACILAARARSDGNASRHRFTL